MILSDMVIELAYAVRRAVKPHLGRQSSKAVTRKTASGDEEFAIDDIAEKTIEEFIDRHDLPVAYFTEGRGLVECRDPEYLLIIDPIDGTRPAMVGLEDCVVSIAAAPFTREACFADVTLGCVLELKSDRLFVASRGGTVSIREGDKEIPVRTTLQKDMGSMSWSYELAGRPIVPIAKALSSLINASSIRGGVFVLNSTAFSLTRLVTGQFDAVVDIGIRLLRDHPEYREEYLQAGLGNIMGIFTYDIAAAAIIAETAGCRVTDAYGRSLDLIPLLDLSKKNICSIVAASNPLLHEKLLEHIEEGMRGLI